MIGEDGKAVFAIQARRAGTKRQPSPEGLGLEVSTFSRARGMIYRASVLGFALYQGTTFSRAAMNGKKIGL